MSNQLLSEYSNSVSALLSLLDSIAPGDLKKAPQTGEWSAAFVVHHMADSEVHFATRFINALAEEKPKIVPFNEEIYPQRLNYEKRDVAASKAALAANSIFVTNLLMGISDSDWNRQSQHPESGIMTITDLLKKVISHYQAHANQLKEIITAI
jgi:uncharacterized damage-inducible protein DinB